MRKFVTEFGAKTHKMLIASCIVPTLGSCKEALGQTAQPNSNPQINHDFLNKGRPENSYSLTYATNKDVCELYASGLNSEQLNTLQGGDRHSALNEGEYSYWTRILLGTGHEVAWKKPYEHDVDTVAEFNIGNATYRFHRWAGTRLGNATHSLSLINGQDMNDEKTEIQFTRETIDFGTDTTSSHQGILYDLGNFKEISVINDEIFISTGGFRDKNWWDNDLEKVRVFRLSNENRLELTCSFQPKFRSLTAG